MESQRRKDHRELIIWQKAMELAAETHVVTRKLPSHELFGLVSQARRAAVSVPSNIAEGAARRTTRELIAFLHVARGSLAELQTQLQLAQRVGYLSDAELVCVQALVEEVGRLLNAVLGGLRRRQEAAL